MNVRSIVLAGMRWDRGDPAELVTAEDSLSSVDTAALACPVTEAKRARDLCVELGDACDLGVFEFGSENHLRAFVRNLSRTGFDNEAGVLRDGDVASPTGWWGARCLG